MNGATLKLNRLYAKLTQPEFAKLMGVSPSQVSRWERDNCPIPHMVSVIYKLNKFVFT